MAIHNMSIAASQQRVTVNFSNFMDTMSSGNTGVLFMVPQPCSLDAINLAAMSINSSPFLLLNVQRFIPGTGYTKIVMGTTFTPPVFGTSGVLPSLGVTLSPSGVFGASAVLLMTNDVVGYQVGGVGGTCGIFGLCGVAVIRPFQDRKYWFQDLI